MQKNFLKFIFSLKSAKPHLGVLVFCLLSLFVVQSALSQSEFTLQNVEIQRSLQKIVNDPNCPEQDRIFAYELLNSPNINSATSLKGTFAISKDGTTGEITSVHCNSKEAYEDVIIGAIFLLQSLVGVVFMIGMARVAIHMGLNADNKEEFAKGIQSIVRLVTYLIINFISYMAIVFGFMSFGVGTSNPNGQYNVVCQQRLVFQIFFSEETPSGDIVDRNVCN